MTASFAGVRARAAARRAVDLAAAGRAAAVSRGLRLVPPPPDRSPERPGPGPVPPQVLRSLDLAVMRRVESLIPGEHLTPQVGGGTDLAMIRPVPAGRRRPLPRLERDRAHERAARARARRRARADVLAAARRLALDELRHRRPPQGRRRGGRGAGRRARRDAAREPARRARLRRPRAARAQAAPGPARAARAARRAAARARGATARATPRSAAPSPRRPRSRAPAGSWSWSRTSAARTTGRPRCARCAGATA